MRPLFISYLYKHIKAADKTTANNIYNEWARYTIISLNNNKKMNNKKRNSNSIKIIFDSFFFFKYWELQNEFFKVVRTYLLSILFQFSLPKSRVIANEFHPIIFENYFLVQRCGKSIGKMIRRLLSDKMERRQVHLKWKMPGGREIEWKKREGKKGWSITSILRESDVSGSFCSTATYFYFYGLLSW